MPRWLVVVPSDPVETLNGVSTYGLHGAKDNVVWLPSYGKIVWPYGDIVRSYRD